MKNHTIQKLIYELVSKLFVFPIYKFVFKGHLIGRDNIPQKDSFIMVSKIMRDPRPNQVFLTCAMTVRLINRSAELFSIAHLKGSL